MALLYGKGVRYYYVGGAVGVDTWAAELLLEMRKLEEYKDIVIRLTIPFPGQADRFTQTQKRRYRRVWERCKKEDRIVVSEAYAPDVYKKRNYYMVDHSGYLLAVYDPDAHSRSGTGVTVNYAKKKGLVIITVHPSTAIVTHYERR
jgi:uncharacterized phage-like protein YoqJ